MRNFKSDGGKFKLHLEEVRYFVNEDKRTVTVTALASVSIPGFISKLFDFTAFPEGFVDDYDFPFGGVYGHTPIKVTWTARCAPEDEFDAEKGKKIAMSKLEANVYQRFGAAMNKFRDQFAKFTMDVVDSCDDFCVRAFQAAGHDLKYIEDISN